jgi:ent-kaurene oxidase
MKTIHLSDGATVPSGSFISMATNSVARDPEYYTSPGHFDGFRFYKKRLECSSDVNKHQFASTSTDNLAFGYGRAACPGRFYASVQVKTLIASLLMQYDVSFGGGRADRPANIFSGEGIGPDRSQTVVFKPLVTSSKI